MKPIILEIENLAIGFKEIIFENINARIQTGTLISLMGINGAGKSCLLKTLGHLIPRQFGQMKINGKDFAEYSALDFSKMVSIVLTEKFQVDFLRVDELVSLGRSPYTSWTGELSQNDQIIVERVMEQMGIERLSSKFFSELSDGQKQKVLIARALAQKPQILILDEPTTYLDIPSKIELLKILRTIASESDVAILMSTHDLDLVRQHIDQIWLMGSDGSFNSGSPEEFESNGLFEKHFSIEKN